MDVRRIISLAKAALEVDKDTEVTKSLATVGQRLNELSSSPSDQSTQLNSAQAMTELRNAILVAQASFSPDELEQLGELTGVPLFSSELLDRIENSLRENPAAPATALTEQQKIGGERDQAFAHLRQFLSTAQALGWTIPEAHPWEAEVGFLIPRSIFENEFDGLIAELRYLRRFLAHLNELQGGSMSEVKLSGLSTTDPLFLLGVGYMLAKEIGSLTAWGLDQWKKVEEIRKIRAETAKLKAFTAEDVETIFGSKIKEEIAAGIEEKVAELVAGVKPAARKHELGNGLRKDLSEFLGRLERGLKVEVHLIGGLEPTDADETPDQSAEQELRRISSELIYPPPSADPVLKITHHSSDDHSA
jgi:hypothetical protein